MGYRYDFRNPVARSASLSGGYLLTLRVFDSRTIREVDMHPQYLFKCVRAGSVNRCW